MSRFCVYGSGVWGSGIGVWSLECWDQVLRFGVYVLGFGA